MRAFDACEAPVVEISERSSFVALEAEWNALVDAVRPEPFYRHEFIRVWLDNFAPNKRWVILSTRDQQGRLLRSSRSSPTRAPSWACLCGNSAGRRTFTLVASISSPEILKRLRGRSSSTWRPAIDGT